MKMIYPESIFCPVCKSTVKLGYETGQNAHTFDIMAFRVDIPYSRKSAHDARRDKQRVDLTACNLIFCKHCKTILGTASELPA
ncbi:MAG: hypothetical protein ACXAC8_20240 [Candidatus Hodarchaeales archaeon]|jgi:hypothetical protein